MQSSYNFWLVAISFVVAALASCTRPDRTYLPAGLAASAPCVAAGRRALKAMTCDEMQGFLLGKPFARLTPGG
ncbi:hypothetical protein [Paraburkholderia sp. SIMBA_030]|uniref:hypothetical protein n=1 Tax=Paraburkholderia sp. SIMBA_030 TaxID=3085773 RepID=UPI00397E700C